ncbi:family 78 glycoside hydrolase catalytic domain [Paenibacillus eucommiae]|uniref:Alpha-L-rhamnosidase n=1 Tax=Paenibacillus eucommiae TaxID=1355755 RepID=A0ABS4J8I0_9BACL|nr:family 78 glycoside hydrolase catalytic domain [Paenibacillus eucommiae]MBP1995381.1 hypothetical protein [Paenibacillus eucommiae]
MMFENSRKSGWIWFDSEDISGNFPGNVFMEARKIIHLSGAIRKGSIQISANQEYMLYVNGCFVGRGPSPCDYRWQYVDTYEIGDLLREGQNCLACLSYHIGQSESTIAYERGPGGLFVHLEAETTEQTVEIGTDTTWKIRRSPRWVQQVKQISRWGGFKEVYLADQEDDWMLVDYDDQSWLIPGIVAAESGSENDSEIDDENDIESPFTQMLPREIPHLHREVLAPKTVVRVDNNLGTVLGAERLLDSSESLQVQSDGSERSKIEPDSSELLQLQLNIFAPLHVKLDASTAGSFPGFVLDFGKVVVGYPQLRIYAAEGGVVDIRYGESLDVQHVDTVILQAGLNEWSPFGRRAFRYMQINAHACPVPIEIQHCAIEQVHYPFGQEGTFACSDPLLNQIWETGKHTVVMNSQEHLEDCPWREKALWVVDELIMAKVIYYVFDDSRLVRKSLLQGARIQKENGAIPATGPESNSSVFVDFCMYWLLAVCDYWKYASDVQMIDTIRPHIELTLDWLAKQEDEQGLLHIPDDHCFIDWAPSIDRREKVTAVSCLYMKTLLELAHLARAFGWTNQSAIWEEKGNVTRAAIRTYCLEPKRDLFVDCVTNEGRSESISLQTNFLAAWCGVMTQAEVERFIHFYEHQQELPTIKSPFFHHFVLESLYDCGNDKLMLQVMRNYWGAMLARGATTWWETFDPATPDCTIPHRFQGNTPTYLRDHVPVSHCHGWGAAPTYILMKMLLGIDASNRNHLCNTVLFRPRLADIDWVQGSVATKYGFIEIAWRREANNSWECSIHAPDSIKLEMDLSDLDAQGIGSKQVYLNGKALFQQN